MNLGLLNTIFIQEPVASHPEEVSVNHGLRAQSFDCAEVLCH
jgi:hypothetical protein